MPVLLAQRRALRVNPEASVTREEEAHPVRRHRRRELWRRRAKQPPRPISGSHARQVIKHTRTLHS